MVVDSQIHKEVLLQIISQSKFEGSHIEIIHSILQSIKNSTIAPQVNMQAENYTTTQEY